MAAVHSFVVQQVFSIVCFQRQSCIEALPKGVWLIRNSFLRLLCLSLVNRFCLCKGFNIDVNTWLILPVVICLSQRLSHACFRLSSLSHICEWLIITVIVSLAVASYMDTCGNSIANTCLQTRLIGRVALVSSRTNPSSAKSLGDLWEGNESHSCCWWCIFSVSDLSAFDGKVLASCGNDG